MLIGEAPIAVRTLANLQDITELDKVDILRPNGERAFHDFTTLESVNMRQSEMIFPRTERLEYRKSESGNFLNGVLHFSVSIDSVCRRFRSASLVLILIFVLADIVVGISLILSIIVEGKETHFDPNLVGTFLERIADFVRINLELKDAEE